MSIFRIMLRKKTSKETMIQTVIADHPETMKAMVEKKYPNHYFDYTLSTRKEPKDIIDRKKRSMI